MYAGFKDHAVCDAQGDLFVDDAFTQDGKRCWVHLKERWGGLQPWYATPKPG